MNILVFSWRGPRHPNAGGAEQVMHEHMKGWIEAGHKVTLFSSHFKKASQEESVDGVKIIRRGVQYWGVHIAGFFWYLFGKHPHFDLIVDQFHGIPFFTPLYSKVKKLAVIQEVAREVWLKNGLPMPFNWIVGIIGYLGEPLVFLLYKRVHFMTGSFSARTDLTKMGISKKSISVVPHGVLVKRPSPFLPKDKRGTIMFLGALMKDKGIEDAIRSFSILNKLGNFRFWVVGTADSVRIEFLKREVSRLGLKDNTKFFGFVSEKRKFELLARARVLINPSIREGWGLVNIEANAVGTPVVAYKSLGLVDSVKNNQSGILVAKNDPESLARAILELFKDNERYSRLQKGALSWSGNFNWEKSKKLSLKLIERIVSEKTNTFLVSRISLM